MSFSSLPSLEHHDDGRTRAPPPALELLDEYWFFSNTLVTSNKKKPPQLPVPSRSPPLASSCVTTEDKADSAGPASRLGARRLLRTPSLPMTMESLPLPTNMSNKDRAGAAASERANQQQAASEDDEVDDDDLNWSSIYEGVLRTRMAEGGGGRSSALRRAPSMPTKNMPRLLRHSHSTLGGRHNDNDNDKLQLQLQVRSDSDHHLHSRSRSQQQTNKSMEVQVRRPALARVHSAAEIKDQLRMWAQAVACNVRQEQEC